MNDAKYQEGFKDGKQETEYFFSLELLESQKKLEKLQKEIDKLTELRKHTSKN